MTARWRLNGWRSSQRRTAIENGGFWLVTPDGRLLRGRPYRLKPTIYLMRMPLDFEVEIDRTDGVQVGQPGDCLALGPRGEMFVVKRQDTGLYDEQPEFVVVGD